MPLFWSDLRHFGRCRVPCWWGGGDGGSPVWANEIKVSPQERKLSPGHGQSTGPVIVGSRWGSGDGSQWIFYQYTNSGEHSQLGMHRARAGARIPQLSSQSLLLDSTDGTWSQVLEARASQLCLRESRVHEQKTAKPTNQPIPCSQLCNHKTRI